MNFQVKRKGVRDDKKDIEVTEEAFAVIETIKDLTSAINELRNEIRRSR